MTRPPYGQPGMPTQAPPQHWTPAPGQVPGQWPPQAGPSHPAPMGGPMPGPMGPAVPGKGLAVAALVCAIISMLPVVLGGLIGWHRGGGPTFNLLLQTPLAIVGVVLGHIALGKVKKGQAIGEGPATAAIVVGYLALADVVVSFVAPFF